MEPLEKTGRSAHAKSKPEENPTETPRESHGLNSQSDTDMQDPLEPSSTDVDERMTRDFKEAIEANANILDNDRIRHAMPKTSNAWNEPENDNDISWRPDPSGHPRRTF